MNKFLQFLFANFYKRPPPNETFSICLSQNCLCLTSGAKIEFKPKTEISETELRFKLSSNGKNRTDDISFLFFPIAPAPYVPHKKENIWKLHYKDVDSYSFTVQFVQLQNCFGYHNNAWYAMAKFESSNEDEFKQLMVFEDQIRKITIISLLEYITSECWINLNEHITKQKVDQIHRKLSSGEAVSSLLWDISLGEIDARDTDTEHGLGPRPCSVSTMDITMDITIPWYQLLIFS
ncbi:hypothetical protein HELRODRAFT_177790 [Helobdella robusta]|uniref:Uncharacterized protein n=1 Tax=Helobdella robusta TaxID=6412 RepID=T1FCA0_HELRO|nr:hypothetical protein HELRODRAFT_177790 [Helobdella robusta]ESN97730.1 hypothetical protein HELRODRAFT_177790 [Helobdella robusta]